MADEEKTSTTGDFSRDRFRRLLSKANEGETEPESVDDNPSTDESDTSSSKDKDIPPFLVKDSGDKILDDSPEEKTVEPEEIIQNIEVASDKPGESLRQSVDDEVSPAILRNEDKDIGSNASEQVTRGPDAELIDGQTPPRGLPAIDQYGFPLPRRVNEIDTEATKVTPAAYAPISRPPSSNNPANQVSSIPAGQPFRTSTVSKPSATPGGSGMPPGGRTPSTHPAYGAKPNSYTGQVRRPAKKKKGQMNASRALGCLLRIGLVGAFVMILVGLCGVSILVYQYYRIAATLPDINDLRGKASQFETTRILDRNGNSLYEILDPNAGRRTYVPLNKISPYVVAATIATEDREFYSHPGFDVTAIVRAFWQNYQSGGEIVSGASTITQQLARTLLFTPQERIDRSYQRKVREAILAAEITRRYTKDEILELYLNENYYGNLAYGIEAAAETYFGSTADKLTLAQASFLAGLPQAPSVYDVYTNRDITLKRHEAVLVLMYQASQESGCIYVSNNPQRVCLDPVAVVSAANELKNYDFKPPVVQMRYPHWVNYVRSLLESQFDAQTIYRSGFTVYTTLDPELQDLGQQIVKEQVDSLADKKATDGALVALQPGTGEILAMVGSADFYNDAIAGQVNMAVSPRQPGSSIKPITYIGALEKGWTPSTLIWDVPSEFPASGMPDDPRIYKPVNYDGRFHGPVTLRYALANSYNIPAVKTLQFVGIYDNPTNGGEDGFISIAKRLGVNTLNRQDYGLSLTLGGGDVTLLDLTGVYATLANGGVRVPPVAITRILDYNGNVVYDYKTPRGDQVIRPEHAYLLTSILSDNEARTPAFGRNSVLQLPFPAAAKTGTTNDFRDNWTLGYTPDLAVGVWVGNADYTPMQNTSGLTGAAPIWSDFMKAAVEKITGGNPTPFNRPGGIIEYVICDISGSLPSQWCPTQRNEIFAADQPPLPKDQDLWRKVELDTWTDLESSPACEDFVKEELVLNVSDPWARKWIKKDPNGQAWVKEMGFDDPVVFAPDRKCTSDDPRPKLELTAPGEGEMITSSPLEIRGIADATQWFDSWELSYGMGDDPVEWKRLESDDRPVRDEDTLYEWDLEEIPAGVVTLRLRMESTEGTYAEKFLHLELQVPTPTPTSTQTPTITPTPTPSPTITLTPTLVPSNTAEATPTVTKFPKATDTFTPEPTITETPTVTLVPP